MRSSRLTFLLAFLTTVVTGVLFPCPARPSEPPLRLADLAWLAGAWEADVDGLLMEEHWLEPRGGLMLGMHRDVRPDGTVLFEYLRIEANIDGVVYLASPRGGVPTPFPLVELEGTRAVFENPGHDFPQRIIYWREGDVLHARTEGDEGGRTRSIEWQWSRAR